MSARKRLPDIERLFEEGTLIDRAIRRGVRDAILAHQRAGVPIVIWKDGKIQTVPAEEGLKPVRKKPPVNGRSRRAKNRKV